MSSHREKGSYIRPSEASWATISTTRRRPFIVGQISTIFFLVFVIVAIAYANWAVVPVVVEGTGKLTSEKPPVPIKASISFRVAKLLVKDNQVVRSGQVLITSDDNLSRADLQKLKQYQETLTSLTQRPMSPQCANCVKRLRGMSNLYLTINAQGDIQTVLSPINDLVRSLITAFEEYGQVEGLVVDSRLQIRLASDKLKEIRKRNAESLLTREVESLNSQIVSHQTRIRERYQERAMKISTIEAALQARVVELQNKLEFLGRNFNVSAPFDGMVTNMKVKGEGEMIGNGQLLFELVPARSKLVAAVEIENRDISLVQNGMPVVVVVDALPEADYGTVDGKVYEIVQADSNNPKHAAAGAKVYVANVALNKQSLSAGGVESPFLLGMTVKGRLLVRQESILKAVVRTLFQIREEVQVKQQ